MTYDPRWNTARPKMNTGTDRLNGITFDRAIKIVGLIVAGALSYATLQAQVSDLQHDKVETERFVLDSASTVNRIGTLERVLTGELPRLRGDLREICRATRANCQ